MVALLKNEALPNDCIDKLFFATQNGMFNIQLKCVEFLSTRTNQPEIKTLLISLISDEVEIVSEAAINTLKSLANPELNKLTEETRIERKAKKKKK